MTSAFARPYGRAAEVLDLQRFHWPCQSEVSWEARGPISSAAVNGTVSPVFVDGNIVYNWEGGVWHPFVTGGVGLYHYRSSENGVGNGSDTRPGANVGGGIEYFYSRRGTITFETLYHAVSEVHTPLATFNEGQFWTFGVGVKRYF